VNKYRVALLGGGMRGREHGEAFKANSDRFEIVAVCDKDTERLAGLSELLDVPATYTDCEKMLAETAPDVFCFATPPAIRYGLVALGVRAGVKAIAYEKPMATSLAEARKMRDLCAEAGVKVILSHQHKYGAHWRQARQIIAAGEIGEVQAVHASAKGWYLHYISHLLDYMMFLIGQPRGQWVIGQVHGTGKLSDNHPSPDYVIGQVAFDNGVRGLVECGELSPDQPIIESFWHNAGAIVHGSAGWVRVIVGYGWQAMTAWSAPEMICGAGGFDVTKDQPLYIADLARWLDDDRQVHPCNGELAYHGWEMAMGILLSALQRRKVNIPIDELPAETCIDRLRRELSPVDA